jgi:calpain-15
MNIQGVTWKRASEIYPNSEIFVNGIDPNDIEQGGLGNCYFLAFLSALAENPVRIQKLFVTKNVNQAGIYLINFYINN